MTSADKPVQHRLFVLQRHIDVSGFSGVGTVAEGVQWSDGTVSLRWRGDLPSVTFWQVGIAAIEGVHGHGGATEVLFISDPSGSHASDERNGPADDSADDSADSTGLDGGPRRRSVTATSLRRR